MNTIKAKASADVNFSINLNLSVGEAKALEALACYGTKQFLEVFYAKLGKTYLQKHETDLTTLFSKISGGLASEINKLEVARRDISIALERLK